VFHRLAAAALAVAALAAPRTFAPRTFAPRTFAPRTFAPRTFAPRTPHLAPRTIQFVFTSDAHYGLTRPSFRGQRNASAHDVNAALVAAINTLPGTRFPDDGGIGAGQPVGAIDFVAEGGDVANREEVVDGIAIQPASASWREFVADYVEGLTVTDPAGGRSPVFVVPGNHDASDAVGFWKPMAPRVDRSAMAGMFNLMVRPATPRTGATFDYATDHVFTSRDIGGVHVAFVQVWPDSRARRWLDGDLAHVPADTAVVIVTHDQPDVEAKHLLNPNGRHDLNDRDRFENLLADRLADGTTIDTSTTIEQRALESFLARHENIVAYFHGNSNWNEFYDWSGPDRRARLHVFRVDSPMKGRESAKDESRLSFQVATIDPVARRITVRECLWNAAPGRLAWGASANQSLVRASAW